MGNPLAVICFFLGLMASIVSGFFVHKFLYHKLKKNWLAFLISLLGVFPLAFLLSLLGRLLIIRTIPGPVGLGEAIGIGIGMALFLGIFIFAGATLYLLTVMVVSVYHWIRKK